MTANDKLCALCAGLHIDEQMIVTRQRRNSNGSGKIPTGNLQALSWGPGTVLALVELVIEAIEREAGAEPVAAPAALWGKRG